MAMAPYEWRYKNGWTGFYTISVSTTDVATNLYPNERASDTTHTVQVRRGDTVRYERTITAPRSQSKQVARQLALEGILFVVGQLLGENQWVQALMLLWQAVKVGMMFGRWVSASQGVDGRQMVRGLLDLAMEGVG